MSNTPRASQMAGLPTARGRAAAASVPIAFLLAKDRPEPQIGSRQLSHQYSPLHCPCGIAIPQCRTTPAHYQLLTQSDTPGQEANQGTRQAEFARARRTSSRFSGATSSGIPGIATLADEPC
jgi:hypothetical protein